MIRRVFGLAFVVWVLPMRAVAATPNHLALHFAPVDRANVLIADQAGNFFVVGSATESAGVQRLRVTKMDDQGAVAQFDFGGTKTDQATGAAVDASGNVVIVGTTNSPDFPLVSPLFSTAAGQAGFIVKLDAQLKGIIFSTKLGGSAAPNPFPASTSINAVAISSSGGIAVTGSTTSTDFPLTSDALMSQPPFGSAFGVAAYGFLTEISGDGSRLVYSTYFGGDKVTCFGGSGCLSAYPYTRGTAISVGQNGNIVLAGDTTANNLLATAGTLADVCNCTNHIQAGFLAVLDSSHRLIWSTYLAAPQNSIAYESNIEVGDVTWVADGVVVVGTAPPGFPTTSDTPQSSAAGSAGFVAKVDSAGQGFLFCTYFGNELNSSGNAIAAVAVDANSNLWITGNADTSAIVSAVGDSILGTSFLAQLSADGSTVRSLFTMPNGAAGQAVAVNTSNVVAALGSSGSLLIGYAGSGPSLVGVVNAAGTQVTSMVAPYELISIFGSGIGPTPAFGAAIQSGSLTTALGGLQVLFDGAAAPLLYAGRNQINAIVPSSVAGHAWTKLEIVTASESLDPVVLGVVPSQPEVFSVAVNQDGSSNSPDHPALTGSIVTIWATGAGTPVISEPDGMIAGSNLLHPALPVSILDDANNSLEVLYAGDAPGLAVGAIQINFRVSAAGPPELRFFRLQVGSGLSGAFAIYTGAEAASANAP